MTSNTSLELIMERPHVLFALAATILAGAVAAQPAADDRSYARAVHERCPGADILKVQRAEFDLVEVEYLCNGQQVEVAFRNGQVMYEEREVTLEAEVLTRIQRSLEKRYAGWLVDEVSLIVTKDTAFLKAEVVLNGVEQNVFFTTTGRKFTPDALLATNKWSLQELAATSLPESGYDLLAPDSVHELPALLREISGIAISSPHTVLCVQDELGVVFEYDLRTEAISTVYRFTDVGDFEDIAVQGDVITVLRSDGKLYHLDRRTGNVLKEKLHPLPALNYEGLCAVGDIHYMVSKEAPVTGSSTARLVHLVSADHVPELWRTLDAAEVAALFMKDHPALAHHGVQFHPSAIAVHPITGELYVLSASDRLLAIYGDALRAVVPLPSERFFKPEGLAFLPNGDLLISNEGDKRGMVPGNVLRFTYRKG